MNFVVRKIGGDIVGSSNPRRLGYINLPTLTRAHVWIFRCKPLISNARILAQLGKFA